MGQLMSSGPPPLLSRSGSHTHQRGEKGSLGLNLSLISTNRGWLDALELEVDIHSWYSDDFFSGSHAITITPLPGL